MALLLSTLALITAAARIKRLTALVARIRGGLRPMLVVLVWLLRGRGTLDGRSHLLHLVHARSEIHQLLVFGVVQDRELVVLVPRHVEALHRCVIALVNVACSLVV